MRTIVFEGGPRKGEVVSSSEFDSAFPNYRIKYDETERVHVARYEKPKPADTSAPAPDPAPWPWGEPGSVASFPTRASAPASEPAGVTAASEPQKETH